MMMSHRLGASVSGRFFLENPRNLRPQAVLLYVGIAGVKLTQLGGARSLGDMDVLAWRPATGLVYAVECKSLRSDRTCGEIGERLREYSDGDVDGKRTPLQRHRDRVSFLEANRQRLADFVGVPVDRLHLRSALVTEQLAPMQFAGKAREMLDLVTDYELLEQVLPQ